MIEEQYADQVRLLVRLLPVVAAEKEFALKGGTAINLFYRNLPRLSVDIDLTYLPIKDRKQSLADIDAAMDRIGTFGESLPGIRATRIPGTYNCAERRQPCSGHWFSWWLLDTLERSLGLVQGKDSEP